MYRLLEILQALFQRPKKMIVSSSPTERKLWLMLGEKMNGTSGTYSSKRLP